MNNSDKKEILLTPFPLKLLLFVLLIKTIFFSQNKKYSNVILFCIIGNGDD